MKTCDNTSVGIVITDHQGRYLMFDRATFPPGTATTAGHIDDHGTAEDAGRAEVEEELGLTVTGLTHVTGSWRDNRCRRLPGARVTGHDWTVYQATVTGDLTPSAARRRTFAGSLPTLYRSWQTGRSPTHRDASQTPSSRPRPASSRCGCSGSPTSPRSISPDDLLRVDQLTR
ncbi:NUDIX hydrolase [Streptomyces sp. NPDC048251]|uniref:NUDIX hydrolase n=1 Tax=Streptomyces sp. NPDC048251 TaxID=3154501 RepID=UPI00341BB6F2